MNKKKILVVEDEPELRMMLALELETSGYQVFQSGDGESGFKLAEEVKPDLIISDVLMPKMDGNQLLKKLRSSDFGKDIPFIVLTARGKMRDYFETVEVEIFIEKPFDADDLLAKVEDVLNRPKVQGRLEVEVSSQGVPGEKAEKGRKMQGKPRILIVENDLLVYMELQDTFRDYGFEVKVVNLPSKCLEEIIQFNPSIIAAKYSLDQIRGDKLVELIRGMPHYKNIPIIIYTNIITGEEKENTLMAGASCFMADVNAVKLLKKANEILKK